MSIGLIGEEKDIKGIENRGIGLDGNGSDKKWCGEERSRSE